MRLEQLDPILPLVQKPARYIGGELNSVIKDKIPWTFALRSASRIHTRLACRTSA